jgi:cytochrome c oxidase assembly protein subunit 15
MRASAGAVWGRAVSRLGFLRLAVGSLTGMFLVVTSGAFVRLTASGLGCERWPRCGTAPFPTEGNQHAIIEFSNRLIAVIAIVLALVTWLASRKVDGLSRLARLSALGAVAGALVQIPLGGVTIMLDLHPLAVMSHFLLAMVVVALSLLVVVEAARGRYGGGAPVPPRWARHLAVWAGLPLAAALVVTGAVATASGPHPGAQEGVERLGAAITDTVYVHVRVAAAFGIGLLLLGVVLWRGRPLTHGILRLWVVTLVVLAAQAVLGEVQYRNALPWGLVLVHVFLAAAVWTLSVALAAVLWRPPAPLLAESRDALAASRLSSWGKSSASPSARRSPGRS